VATDVTAAVIKIIERTNPPAAGRAAHPGDDWAAGRRRGNRLGAPPGDRGIVPALKVVAPRARSATAATTLSAALLARRRDAMSSRDRTIIAFICVVIFLGK